MTGRDLARTATAELSPLADAQTILEAIISNGQSNIFLVDVGPGDAFYYVSLIEAGRPDPARGLSFAAARRQTPIERFGPEAGAAVVGHYRDCLAAGHPITYEEMLPSAGAAQWWQTSLTPMRDGAGRIVQILGIAIDITERKRAESELRERERRLSDFAEFASDWLWEMDGELRFTRLSDRFFALYELDADKVLGRRWDQIVDPSQDVEVWDEMLNALAEWRAFSGLVFRRWVRGLPVGYVKISGRPVFDESGAFRGFRGTASDLTAQRVAEERAAAASARLLNAIEGLSEGVAIFDAHDALVLCNARYRELSGSIAEFVVPGAHFETLLRKGIEQGLYPAAIGGGQEWLTQRMAAHRAARGSFERQTQNGEWLQVVEQRTSDGGVMVLETDITEVKRRETALTMLTSAGQGDANFFEDAVRSLAAGLGYRFAGICQLIDGDTRLAPLALCDGEATVPVGIVQLAGTGCAEVLRTGSFLAVERGVLERFPDAVLLRGLGAVSYVCDVVRDVTGRPVGFVYGFDDKPDPHCLQRRDITGLIAARVSLELQRRETEAQLRAAKEGAEIANRAKSEFLANMSHELRTPLNAVIGFAQMIGEEILGPVGRAEYREYARDIHASSLHLLQIINDILDVSKIEAGMLTLCGSAVEFEAVAQACMRLVAPKAQASEITLNIELPDLLPVVWADERMLKQITLNLLSNALKFTPKGGTVTLKAWGEPDGGMGFSVNDTGIGIAEEDFEKVFRPFGQVDSSMARRFEGTGLGLPLSKGLVELHGGTITLKSAVGKGTTVTVLVPRGLR